MEEEEDPFGNDPLIEEQGIILAINYADSHWNKIVEYNIARRDLLKENIENILSEIQTIHLIKKFLSFSKDDFRLYYCFRSNFPFLNVKFIFEDDLKDISSGKKEIWRNFMSAMDGRIDDYNQLSILRIDPRLGYTEENSFLVPRIQFVCIEIARNIEGVNNLIYIDDIKNNNNINNINIVNDNGENNLNNNLIHFHFGSNEEVVIKIINQLKEKLNNFLPDKTKNNNNNNNNDNNNNKNIIINYNPNEILGILSSLANFFILPKSILQKTKIGLFIREFSKYFKTQLPIYTSSLSLLSNWKKSLEIFLITSPSSPSSSSSLSSSSLLIEKEKKILKSNNDNNNDDNNNNNNNNNDNNNDKSNLIDSQFSKYLINILVNSNNEKEIIDQLFEINKEEKFSSENNKNKKIRIEITLSAYSYLFASKLFILKNLFKEITEKQISPRYKLSLEIENNFPFISKDFWAILRIIHLNFEEFSEIFQLNLENNFISENLIDDQKYWKEKREKFYSKVSENNEFSLLSTLLLSLVVCFSFYFFFLKKIFKLYF